MVEVALFNINDISLLFGGFLALVLACLLVFTRQCRRIAKIYWQFLALFFFLGALRAFDTLIYLNASVRDTLSLVSANIFFVFGLVFFLQGPLLMWFTRANIFRNFAMRPADLIHLIPAVFYPVYIYLIFHRLAPDQTLQYVHDWAHVVNDPYFESLIWTQRLALFGYSAFCVFQFHQYRRQSGDNYSDLNKVDLDWLKLLVFGFFIINGWTLLVLIDTRLLGLLNPEIMLQLESHFMLIYISVLVVYLLKKSHLFSDATHKPSLESTSSDRITLDLPLTQSPEHLPEEPQQQLVEKLTDFMVQSKPYLEPHITVERLAIKLNVSPKLLSCTINNQLKMNFFELIGTYRVEEAKKRLADTELRQKPISEIMKSCGFNSKSVFNQAFKKTVGVTPSHYRQQHLP